MDGMCAASGARADTVDQTLSEMRRRMPFPLLGFDTEVARWSDVSLATGATRDSRRSSWRRRHALAQRSARKYHPPATPYQQLIAADVRISDVVRRQVTAIYKALDPVQLLHTIRELQQKL